MSKFAMDPKEWQKVRAEKNLKELKKLKKF
jgi:hypothetical protein